MSEEIDPFHSASEFIIDADAQQAEKQRQNQLETVNTLMFLKLVTHDCSKTYLQHGKGEEFYGVNTQELYDGFLTDLYKAGVDRARGDFSTDSDLHRIYDLLFANRRLRGQEPVEFTEDIWSHIELRKKAAKHPNALSADQLTALITFDVRTVGNTCDQVFLATFDSMASSGSMPPPEEYNPVFLYGCCKAEIERRITADSDIQIIPSPELFYPDKVLEWMEKVQDYLVENACIEGDDIRALNKQLAPMI